MPSLRSDASGTKSDSSRGFIFFFALYLSGVVFLLGLGLATATAAVFPSFRALADSWGQGNGAMDQVWRAIARTASLTEQPWEFILDYVLSILNLGFGVFIVWHRPRDWVARLLGLGMVGTAMAYNYQAHGILTILRPLNVLHYVYHATAGATYLHALVLFPNGKLVPRKFVWIVGIIYFLMIEETVLPILKLTLGRLLFLAPTTITAAPGSIERFAQLLFSVRGGGIIIAALDNLFRIDDPLSRFSSIIDAETTFFVLLFGLLIPIVGVISQVYRYRAVSSTQERQQTKFVVWALSLSFIAGLAFVIAVAAQSVTNRAGLTIDAIDEIEQSVAWIFPAMVSVIPIALLFSISRYRLFDIDLVINRTLVYGSLTAILAGVFAALSNVLQRLFLALTGEQSEIAVVVSALVVAMTFAPIRAWLQSIVDRHFREVRNPGKDLNRFGQQVQTSIELSTGDQLARHFLDTVARAFDVECGAIRWGKQPPFQLLCTYGTWNGDAQITVSLEINGEQFGIISLGARRNGLDYTAQDRESLQHTARLVAQAIRMSVK